MIITPLQVASEQGKAAIRQLHDRFQMAGSDCRQKVEQIIAAVKADGDQALIAYTNQFDAPKLTIADLRVSEAEFKAAEAQVSPAFQATLDKAIGRIRTFHEHEREDSWMVTREDGTITGRLVHPVDSAGLYVPGGQGGKTPLVSSVLMNGIPAAIAGVKRMVMLTPPDQDGRVNPALLLAARKIGIHEVYKAGSAWGIAALAYGTTTIRPVDVIVGPGNQFVTEAKKQVAGRVRIDMIAGPSEVLIIADDSAKPAFIAADMLAQAEHDPMALAMLITTSADLAQAVVHELERLLPQLSRQEIAARSLKERGVILVAANETQALDLANDFAAEHLELMLADPYQAMTRIRHAGAIFLGNHSPEATGDYLAGPNHVLPTMGTARFSSSLGVETFLKKCSLISYSRQALLADADDIQAIANLEGLSAHALSVAIRVTSRMISQEVAGQFLSRGLHSLGLNPLPATGLAQLWLYFAELDKWNRKMNLVAQAPALDILETHFLDSLTLLPQIADGPLLDVGSGAGFPGLVVKIACPELSVTLLEPRQKRVTFLQHVIRTLKLSGIQVVAERLDTDDMRFVHMHGQFPLITSRALAEIDSFLNLVTAIAPPQGRVVCMKGPKVDEEIAGWRQKSPASPFVIERSVHFNLPSSGAERRLIVFKKRSPGSA